MARTPRDRMRDSTNHVQGLDENGGVPPDTGQRCLGEQESNQRKISLLHRLQMSSARASCHVMMLWSGFPVDRLQVTNEFRNVAIPIAATFPIGIFALLTDCVNTAWHCAHNRNGSISDQPACSCNSTTYSMSAEVSSYSIIALSNHIRVLIEKHTSNTCCPNVNSSNYRHCCLMASPDFYSQLW
jgi:hypothetical protein